ncbi:MAG: hypothetical protein LQ350_006355 [Teloschistes chrysophthalmus]|nr:MAG: hypothetical protein LQ350_006355 [Niorma chrysophthalma]
MYGLSVGISKVNEILPRPVYALLSGLNSATVGVIALAAVQLSQKAITDKTTRVLVFLGATAGMLYNALWYFPLLMFLAGLATVTWDFRWLHRLARFGRKKRSSDQELEMNDIEHRAQNSSEDRGTPTASPSGGPNARSVRQTDSSGKEDQRSELPISENQAPNPTPELDLQDATEERVIPADRNLNISWQFGASLILAFLATFAAVMILRGVLTNRPLLFSLFANLYLAGTIIFGGGPVVIPLLREYVVNEGWVSPRDFLLGLAMIQAFPGPNFNFAVYLGSLAALSGSKPSAAGALLAYIAIFSPGLILVHGTMGLWGKLRTYRWVKSGLRGINAAAVGLVYTAVYRLWQIGYVDAEFTAGTSLGRDPWWVVVTATSYVGCFWFGVPIPLAILMGGVMGLVWFGVVSN